MGLGITISSCVVIQNCINLEKYIGNVFIYVLVVISALTASFGLYLWIRRSITAHYRERLQLKSEEHYQALLNEKEHEIEKLNQSNEFLAKVVHRDNHLMSSLNSSIDAYFKSDDSEFRDELLRNIQTLAKERGELIAKEQREAKILPSTGNLLIDGSKLSGQFVFTLTDAQKRRGHRQVYFSNRFANAHLRPHQGRADCR